MRTIPCLLAGVFLSTPCSCLSPTFDAHRSLPVSPDTDPFANRDPFLDLGEAELHRSWSHNSDEGSSAIMGSAQASYANTLTARLDALKEMQDSTYVDVRLVGFEGNGNGQIHLESPMLQKLLDALPYDERQRVMHPLPGGMHELPVSRRFLFRTTHGSKPLAERVASAVQAHSEAAGGAVPLSAVDELIRADYRQQRSSHITMYLLNPSMPRQRRSMSGPSAADGEAATSNSSEWWETLRYWYKDDGGAAEGGGAEGSGAVDGPRCPTVKWVGIERYLWVDLSAGPLAYGPATHGLGVVTEHSLPRVTPQMAAAPRNSPAPC